MQHDTDSESRKRWDRPRLSKLAADLAEVGSGIRTEGSFGAVLS